MPTYDRQKVQDALQLVAEGLTYAEVSEKTGMGKSTIERHVTEYRQGNRPDISVGELPMNRKGNRSGRKGGNASLVRVTARLSAETHAEQMTADATVMEQEAGRLEQEASRLRAEADGLKKAAKLLEREMKKAEEPGNGSPS